MANFKGGFAFNNEAAKVEVEQAPDGTLISCVNPVTGEELGGGNSKEVITGTAGNLFGNISTNKSNEILADLTNNNISIVIKFDLSSVELPAISIPVKMKSGYGFIADNLTCDTVNGVGGFYVQFTQQIVDSANSYFNATGFYAIEHGEINLDGTAHASAIPTTTTIYHHPMPE